MGVGGHDRRSAEALNDLLDSKVRSGYIDLLQPGRGARALPDPLNHRFAADVQKRLVGKSRCRKSRGDDADDLHGAILLFESAADQLRSLRSSNAATMIACGGIESSAFRFAKRSAFSAESFVVTVRWHGGP